MANVSEITTEVCAQRIAYALKRCVGPNHEYQHRDELAAAIGVDPRSMRAYWNAESAMKMSVFLRTCHVLGPTFADQCLSLSNLYGTRQRGGRPRELDINSNLAALMDGVAETLADEASPGRMDRREYAELRPKALKLLSAVSEFFAVDPEDHG